MTRILAAATAALLACGGTPATPTRPHGDLASGVVSIPPTPLYSGECEFPDTRAVLRGEAEWAAAWATRFACVAPPPALPAIDFAREMLVLVALGARPTGGYAVAIESAVESDGVLRVVSAEYRPGPGCVTTQVITWPVAVARVPRTDAAASFHHAVVSPACD